MAIKQIINNPGLLATCLLITFSVMFFNMSSMNLTKRVSCIYSAFWSATRTACVWIVSLLVGLETWNWTTSPIQFVGFVFLVTGNLTYNEMIEWKVMGMNKKMAKYLKEGDGMNK